MNYLVLTFDGIMQYYSAVQTSVVAISQGYYKTEKCPTKAAVIGMLGAILGYSRDDSRIEQFHSVLDIKYLTTKKGSIMQDFQTAKPFDGECFMTVDGKKRGVGDGIIKTVEYLQDYAFKVYVGADDELLKMFYKGFCNPVYEPYFGKRSCTASRPIVTSYEIISKEDLEAMINVHDCP